MTRALTPVASSPTDPRFTTVVSSSGFSAGDYVYQRPDGTYGPVPNGAVATASFNVDNTLPNVGTGESVYATYPLTAVAGGTSRARNVAKLSNGNLVIVYRQLVSAGAFSINRAVFTVVDSTGATVVAPVEVSSTILPLQNSIHVLALTGGGFVLYFADTTNAQPTYGIYTNAGAVTTALAIDTGATAINSSTNARQTIYGCALPNGGFAFAYNTTANTIVTRAFNSTGTPAYAWTTVGATQAVAFQQCNIVARSDSTTAVAYLTSSSITYAIGRISTAGAVVTHGWTTTSQIINPGVDICCLTNDTLVAVYYNDPSNNTNIAPRYITLSPANVLGSQTAIPTGGVFTAQSVATERANIFVTSLSNGGFIAFFHDSNYQFYYVPFNSSGVALNIGTNVTCFGDFVSYGPTMHPSFIETSGYLDVYYAAGGDGNVVSGQYAISNFKSTIELTNYTLYSPTSTNVLIGTTTQPVTNYARVASTPTNASFFPTTTGAVPVDISRGSIVLASREVDSAFSANSTYFAVDTNSAGQVLIVYKASTSSALRAVLYSATGTLINAITVAIHNTSSQGTLGACFLSNGKIVIADGRTGNVANIYIYNSTLTALLNSVSGVTGSGGKVNVAALTGVTGGRFVYAHLNASNYPTYTVYSDTGTVVSGPNVMEAASGVSTNQVDVCGLANGSFAAMFYMNSITQNKVYTYNLSATDSWTPQVQTGFGASGNFTGGRFLASTQTGILYALGSHASSGSLQYYVYGQTTGNTSLTNIAVVVEASTNLDGKFSMGLTGSGVPVIVNLRAGAAGIDVQNWGPRGQVLAGNALAPITDYSNFPNTAPWFGNNIVVAYRASSGRINYAIINAIPYSCSETLTTNVTPSRVALNLNPSSSSGYTLIGVAATDCAAGGAGQVQVNGVATVNSQYSASTAYQGFDFQVPGNRGVRGTVAGSTVTLIGDA